MDIANDQDLGIYGLADCWPGCRSAFELLQNVILSVFHLLLLCVHSPYAHELEA